MTLFEQIKADQLAARKAKDGLKATLLTTLIGELTAIGKNDGDRAVTDADVVKLVKKFLDGVNETVALMKDVSNNDGSADRYVNLLKEQSYLTVYMPQQMDEAKLTEVLTELVTECGPNLGKLMGLLKARYAGQYDGGMASKIAKAVL
jgi:uncharacterized protein YqeY